MKKIAAEIEIKSNIQPTIAELKKLKLQIKDTADPAEFKKLTQQYNDMEDAIKSAKVGANNFAEVLGTLPGPIGSIGSQVGGTLQNLKQFGALKFNDIKNSFTELGKDIVDAGKGLGKLTGITKVYTMTARSLSTGLQSVGVSANTATVAARGLSLALTATGILLAVAVFAQLANAVEYYSTKAEKAEEAQKKLNETIQKGNKAALDASSASVKRSGDLLLAQAKARGANADEIFKIEQSNRKLLVASQERYYNDIKNKDSDEAISALQTLKDTQNSILVADADFKTQKLEKSKAANEKEQGVDKQNLESIKKNAIEATNSLLTEREQQRQKITDDYSAKIKLAEQYGKDTYVLKEAQNKAQKDLQDKFDKEDNEKKIAAAVQEYENLITDIDAKNGLLDYDFQEDLQRLANKEAYLAAAKLAELANTELTLKERNEIIQKYAQKERDVEKDITATKKAEIQARTDIQLQYADTLQRLGSLIGQIAGDNKDLAIASIIIEQGAALAKVIISTMSANAAATAAAAPFVANPFTAIPASANLARVILMNNITGAISAAGIIAGAVKGISAINSAKVPGGSGGGSASSNAAIPAYTGGPTAMPTPQITGTEATTPGSQIAQTIAASSGKPVRAYVVSGDISSQQALDRKTNRGATFGLG